MSYYHKMKRSYNFDDDYEDDYDDYYNRQMSKRRKMFRNQNKKNDDSNDDMGDVGEGETIDIHVKKNKSQIYAKNNKIYFIAYAQFFNAKIFRAFGGCGTHPPKVDSDSPRHPFRANRILSSCLAKTTKAL